MNSKGVPDNEGAIPKLNQLYFYLTEGCNLACRHCWLAPPLDREGNKYPALPVRLFEAAVSEGKALGVKRVKLTGGEPLLHPDILTLIDIVYREELTITVESNGLLCTAAVAAAIARFPDKFMSISLDGTDAASHERIRGVAGSFKAACAAVQLLAAHGVKPQIIMTVMGSNRHQVDAMVRLAERLGAASVKFNLVQPTARGKALVEADETPGIQETIALGRYVEGELARTTDLRLHFDFPVAFRPMSRIAEGREGGICGILGIIGVLATGHYALCGIGKHVPDLVFGEIGKDRLAFVWEHNAVLGTLRKGIPGMFTGVCGRCLMKRMCFGKCVAQNYYRSGSIEAPFWFCEVAETEGLFPSSRLASSRARTGQAA